jgi:heptosyltransferase III
LKQFPPKNLLGPDAVRNRLEKIPRLLLVRLRSLGDSILSLPLLQALHSWRPELELDILVESTFSAVFASHPAVHETLVLAPRKNPGTEGWSRMRGIAEIRKRRYRAVVDLHGGSTARIFTYTSGAGLRIGEECHHSRIYNVWLPASSAIWDKKTLHTVEHQMALMKWLGLPIPDNTRARLHIPPDSKAGIARRLGQSGIADGRYFLIHPTATLATKQWTPSGFAEIGDRLFQTYGLPVIYTSGPHEAQVLIDIGQYATQRHWYWSDVALPELFAVIDGCRLFVGNDSGPAHAAAALGKPVVVVWGSSSFHAWHPWKTDFELIRSDLPCMPCSGYSCAEFGQPRCILEIPISRVWQGCVNILARGGASQRMD